MGSPRRSLARVAPLGLGLVLLTVSLWSIVPIASATGTGSAPTADTNDPECDPESGPPMAARFEALGRVLLGRGTYLFKTVDVYRNGGLAYNFIRAYSSIDGLGTRLGPGWMDNFETRLGSDGRGNVLWTEPDNYTELFVGGMTRNSTGTAAPYRVLTIEPRGGWTLDD